MSDRAATGWVKLRWHYSRRPDRDPSTPEGKRWLEEERPLYAPEAWSQEMEIDYLASAPGRIWGDYFEQENLVLSPDRWQTLVEPYKSSMQLFEGWDFGSGDALTAVVWAYYSESVDRLFVVDFHEWHRATAPEVAEVVREKTHALFGHTWARRYDEWAGEKRWACDASPDKRLGDIAGKQGGPKMTGGRIRDDIGSWIKNLGEQGIKIRGHRLRVESAISRVTKALVDGRLLFGPRCAHKCGSLPSLVECVEQYRRDVKSAKEGAEAFVGETPKPLKDIYSHAADALQHVAWAAWPRDTGGVIYE